MFVIVRDGKIIYARKRVIDGDKSRTITFIDTWNYQKMSVEDMGLMLRCHKFPHPECFGKQPQSRSDRKMMDLYCRRDALITWKYANPFKDFCDEMVCKVKATISSTGLDYWRRHDQQGTIWRLPEDLIKYDLENAYKGGRCEAIQRGYFQQKIYCYDYNSHYPGICFEGVDGKGSYPDPNSWHVAKQGNTDLIEQYEGIAEVKLDIPRMHLPPLGIHLKDKLVFPTGHVSTVATFPEIRQAIKQGAKVLSIGKTVYYTELSAPFRNTINTLYSKRKKYKLEGHAFEQMVKTMMNGGIYGKFGYNPYNKEVIKRDEDVFIDDEGLYVWEKNEKVYFQDFIERDGTFYLKQKVDQPAPTYCVPIYATYTTALARCKLFNDANKVSRCCGGR